MVMAYARDWKVKRLRSKKDGMTGVRSFRRFKQDRADMKAMEEQLIRTARDGKSEEMKQLIAKGVNINHVNSFDGLTPLMFASDAGHVEVVKVLLAAGASPNDANNLTGKTALMYARQHIKVVTELLAACPDGVKKKEQDGNTALHVAFKGDAPEAVTLALIAASQGTVAEMNRDGNTALHVALESEAPEAVVLALITTSPEAVAEMNQNGSYPLHLSLWNSATETISRKLLEAHSDATKTRNTYDNTPLYLAVYHRETSPELILSVLAANPDAANVPGMSGNTPLHLALEHGAPKAVVSALIAATSDAVLESLPSSLRSSAAVYLKESVLSLRTQGVAVRLNDENAVTNLSDVTSEVGNQLMSNSHYFHGKIDELSVVQRLKEVGDFLVRESKDKAGQLVLCLRLHPHAGHFDCCSSRNPIFSCLIEKTADGMFNLSGHSAEFQSAKQLVWHYHEAQVPVTASHCLLTCPLAGAAAELDIATSPPNQPLIIPGQIYVAKRMCHGLTEENELTIYKGDTVTAHRSEDDRIWATHNNDGTTGWVKLIFLKLQ